MKGSIITDIMLIKIDEEYGKKECQVLLFSGKEHTVLFTCGIDSAVIKMFLEQIIIYKISRLRKQPWIWNLNAQFVRDVRIFKCLACNNPHT